jgi:hypothetical protein
MITTAKVGYVNAISCKTGFFVNTTAIAKIALRMQKKIGQIIALFELSKLIIS